MEKIYLEKGETLHNEPNRVVCKSGEYELEELVEVGEFAVLNLGFTDGSVDSSYHVLDVPQPVLRGKGQQQFVSGHWRQKTSEFHVR